MFKLNKKMEYALISLDYINRRGDSLVTAKEVSEEIGVSFDGVARVMQILSQHQVLKAEQGAGGGYQLCYDLGQLSFYELMEMVLGRTDIAKCLHKGEVCDLMSKCNIKDPVQKLNEKLVQFYSQLSLEEILKPNSGLELLKRAEL